MAAAPHRLQNALSDRYRIERELGRGGMATVYLAQDLKHQRPVAIKVLDPELAAVIGAERFLREIEVAARLNHPHILPLHDSGSADGLLYYVMPYAEGQSLRHRLARDKQLPVADALRIAREVAGALDYAHRRGLIHRDIKPENILLLEQHAVVADFGIALALAAAGDETLTATGVVIGTPIYMSPEQTGGSRSLDGRSDLYSLGCVLYEMLAGHPPFTAPTAESLSHQHLSVTPRPVRELRPAVPEEVERALARTLAKAAADRYGTAAELAAALAPREASAPAPQAPAAFAEAPTVATAATRRRLWQRVALLGGTAVLVAAVAWLVLNPHGVRPPAPPRTTPVATKSVHERSEIAVLPFQNLSAAGPHAYFAGGLHDELLTQLSKVAALKVISRTSVMGYRETTKPLKAIAEELGVGSVVEGSVQVDGERLRVNVQLIDAATDEHLWAERYDRTLNDAFAIQSEVAQRIVAAVGAALSRAEQGRITASPTANAEAYRLYLQGGEYVARPGILRRDRETAEQLYERALVLDPNFALAHAALSNVHGQMYFLRYDPSEARAERQRHEAETALRLAPDLPQAHIAMGLVYYRGRRDYRKALDEFSIALEGLPNDAALWNAIGTAHRRLGEWNDALAAVEKAQRLDPRDAALFLTGKAPTFHLLRRYADAVQEYDRALSLAPDLHIATIDRARIYVQWQGQLDTLREALGRLPQDAELVFVAGVPAQRAELLLWERRPDSLLAMPQVVRGDVFSGNEFFLPGALYSGWAHRMRGDRALARVAFESALERLDSARRELPNDWRLHAARGLALAGLGRRDEARREARWLQQSPVYRVDAFEGPRLAENRARILTQAGDAEAALEEIARLLARPSWFSVHSLRLDPLYDPLREYPQYKALLAKYGA